MKVRDLRLLKVCAENSGTVTAREIYSELPSRSGFSSPLSVANVLNRYAVDVIRKNSEANLYVL